MTEESARPRGWFPNPDGSGGYRLFDGRTWTGHVRRSAPPAPPLRVQHRGRLLALVVVVVVLLALFVLDRVPADHPPAAGPVGGGAVPLSPHTEQKVIVPSPNYLLPAATIPVLQVPPPGPGVGNTYRAPTNRAEVAPTPPSSTGSSTSTAPAGAAAVSTATQQPPFVAPVVVSTRMVNCVPHAGGDGADLVVAIDFAGGADWSYDGNGIGGDEYRFVVLSEVPTFVNWVVDFGPVDDLNTQEVVPVSIPGSLVLRVSCGDAGGRQVTAEW